MFNLFGQSRLGDFGNTVVQDRMQSSNFGGLYDYIQQQYPNQQVDNQSLNGQMLVQQPSKFNGLTMADQQSPISGLPARKGKIGKIIQSYIPVLSGQPISEAITPDS